MFILVIRYCKTRAESKPLKTRTLTSPTIHGAIGSSRDFETITAVPKRQTATLPQIDSRNLTVCRLRIFGGLRAISRLADGVKLISRELRFYVEHGDKLWIGTGVPYE